MLIELLLLPRWRLSQSCHRNCRRAFREQGQGAKTERRCARGGTRGNDERRMGGDRAGLRVETGRGERGGIVPAGTSVIVHHRTSSLTPTIITRDVRTMALGNEAMLTK